jgi:hypothetical protein
MNIMSDDVHVVTHNMNKKSDDVHVVTHNMNIALLFTSKSAYDTIDVSNYLLITNLLCDLSL